ncbi:MAG TPA: polymorphic toxin type 44 domain-containing protein [Polyangiaceae bacterium]|nr:polymorphic toxin type 44 domain-containing protein [Polyangiaceae bacterium]
MCAVSVTADDAHAERARSLPSYRVLPMSPYQKEGVCVKNHSPLRNKHSRRSRCRGAAILEYVGVVGIVVTAAIPVLAIYREKLLGSAGATFSLTTGSDGTETGQGSSDLPLPPAYGPQDQAGIAKAAHDQMVADGKRYDDILKVKPGFQTTLLKTLPGGSMPTREELSAADAIVRKYEAELRQHQGDPNFNMDDFMKRLGQELEPMAREHRNDFTWWYYMVKTDSVFDLKNRKTDPNAEQLWDQPWDFSSAGVPKKASTGDTAGNWLYGYLGAEVFGAGALGQSTLIGGAGAAQAAEDKGEAGKRLLQTGWIDNPGDAEKIHAGIEGYMDVHGPAYVFLPPGRPPGLAVPGPSNRDAQLEWELAKAGVADAGKGIVRTGKEVGELVDKGVQHYVVDPLRDWAEYTTRF